MVKSVRALEEMVFTDSTAKQLMYCQHLLGSYCIGSTFRERQAEKPGLSREISSVYTVTLSNDLNAFLVCGLAN